jgi:hypothetical protein
LLGAFEMLIRHLRAAYRDNTAGLQSINECDKLLRRETLLK